VIVVEDDEEVEEMQVGVVEDVFEGEEEEQSETFCAVCGCNDDREEQQILLCDGCVKEYHTYCLKPPLKAVPEGKFFGEWVGIGWV
jgi:hypothetical protein